MIIILKNGNCYHYSENNKILSPLPRDIFYEQPSQHSQYYREKLKFILEHCDEKEEIKQYAISSEEIKMNFFNVSQITFEVTEACNLQCHYCAYSDLYVNKRESIGNLKFETVKVLFDFLKTEWEHNYRHSSRQLKIGFYGGEALLNFSLIRKIVDYAEPMKNWISIAYTITTNALLLDKYIDYLVKNNFLIVISLDGNETNHSYRTDKNGNNSFNKVISNVDMLYEKYPDYFERNVSFNAVLHDRNSVNDICNFTYQRYGKYPSINELMEAGVQNERKDHFEEIFKSFSEDLSEWGDSNQMKKMFMILPTYRDAYKFLSKHTPFIYQKYNNLLYKRTTKFFYPNTGTCVPFSRKIFVTANGNILPCERISQQFTLGHILKDKVVIDFKKIAKQYNEYYDKLYKQCSTCFQKKICGQCIFHLNDLDEYPKCKGHMAEKAFVEYIGNMIAFFETHPDDYPRLMNEVIIQ